MEGLLLLLLLALGGGSKKGNGNGTGTGNGNGNGNGNGHVGPAGVGPIPSGDPPGGCRLVYDSPEATVQAMAMLGYTPMAEIWGPDAKLGTWDADSDIEVRQFQLDYNQASRSGWLGNMVNGKAGGLTVDGFMGQCTMSAIEHADVYRGPEAWRERYMPRPVVSIGG